MFDWYKDNVIYERGNKIIVDKLKQFPNGEMFSIFSGEYDYFWMKHAGKILPVMIRYNKMNGFHYMMLDHA